jgi:oxygen-independent coproporphyrinogen-3 oxidase
MPRDYSDPGERTPLRTLIQQNPDLRIEQDDYNINVTANYGTALSAADVAAALAVHHSGDRPVHLYFHVPLCSYLCHFCNYVKQLAPRDDLDESLEWWTATLIDESSRRLRRAPWIGSKQVESLYLGGGTAALLTPTQVGRILAHARAEYSLTPACEITVEGNPENFGARRLAHLCAVGVNRFSVGIQSFDDEVNHFAGRRHSAEAAWTAVEALLDSGRPFNVDMMFGLPRQTVSRVAQDIRRLAEAAVPTITIYRLRNADRHAMGIGNRAVWNVDRVREKLHASGEFPSLDVTCAMRDAAVEILVAHGYRPSPCGWWSLPGTYPDGNIPAVSRNKWQHYDPMLACGPGAYGWLTGTVEAVQTHNIADINEYREFMRHTADELPFARGRRFSVRETVATALGFAFKAAQPINASRFLKDYGVSLAVDEPYASVLAELCRRKFLERRADETDFVPTLDGEALHEEIISVYFHDTLGSSPAVLCRRAAATT